MPSDSSAVMAKASTITGRFGNVRSSNSSSEPASTKYDTRSWVIMFSRNRATMAST